MYRLKLIKGKTYWGAGVKASQEKPFVEVETEEHADHLVKTGYFIMIEEEMPVQTMPVQTKENTDADLVFPDGDDAEDCDSESSILEELQKKKKEELIQYASGSGIDITGCKTKDDMISKILEALARAAAARDAIRCEA